MYLNLAKNELTHSGMERFAPILAKTDISELDLSLNPLGNSGVRCLIENLWEKIPKYNSTVSFKEKDLVGVNAVATQKPAEYRIGKPASIVKLTLS